MIQKVAVIGTGALLLLAAFFAGWTLSPDSSPTTAAAQRSSSATDDIVMANQQDPMDEMTRLCTRHMSEMRPVMEQMMRDMMR